MNPVNIRAKLFYVPCLQEGKLFYAFQHKTEILFGPFSSPSTHIAPLERLSLEIKGHLSLFCAWQRLQSFSAEKIPTKNFILCKMFSFLFPLREWPFCKTF